MQGVELIKIPPDVARAKLRAYRENVHKDAEEDYRQCAEAYAAAAEGHPLVDLAPIFRSVPNDEKGRPRLAIARADRDEVCFWGASEYASDADRSRYVFDARAAALRGHHNSELVLQFPGTIRHRRSRGFAPVPMVPADVRPKVGQLRDWFILWEVDHWADRSRHAPPPVDPLLLKWIGGTLYAVLAEWNLSPLERAIMAGALRA